jgi:hypothetical protein
MPDSGKDLGVDLYDLWRAGRDNLPSVAHQYRVASGFIATDLAATFRRSDRLGGPYGQAYRAWAALRDDVERILTETADNLDAVAEALCLATQRYAGTDAEAAEEFRRLIRVNGEPQPGRGGQ